MEYENVLDKKKLKEIKDLAKQKQKCKEKGNFIEAAKIANCIGEILSENSCFQDAIDEHKEEIYFSEASNDTIGVAVGNRKVGECFCEIGCFDEALEHQQKHLKLAKSVSNYIEQQRALATIGRTYFVQAERLNDDETVVNESLVKSQEAYLRSLDICNMLKNEVSEKDILEMKARLYLNLGLVYEYRHSYNEAMKFVSKALVISKEQQLQDNIFRCHLTLFGLHFSNNDLEKALQSSKSALMIAQKENKKANEREALSQMGLALLRLENFGAALNSLKKVYKLTKQSCDPIVASHLKQAIRFVRLTSNYDKCDNKNELLDIYEKLGDLYAEINSPEKALNHYFKQLKTAEALNLSGKSLASIFVSIAVTYSDLKQYDKALEYHQKELNVKHGDLDEKSSTYCAIANCLEHLNSPFQEIKDYYMKALECAQGSGNHSAEIKVYHDWSATLHGYDMLEEYENVQLKLKHIAKEYDIIEDESQILDEDASGLPVFSDGELEMIESSDEDIEEKEVSHSTARKTTSKKINKVNERGETPLHCAAINGNFERVKTLLLQGASVKCRDYCGWTPLHEACNHGHTSIVKVLIQYQADVNDPGGQHCGKVTPLHDASQNGHIEVVKLLVENGASIEAKTKDGLTPLDLVKNSIEADKEEFSNNSQETSFTKKLKEVEKYLSNSHNHQKYKVPETSKNRNDKLFGNLFGSSSEDDNELCPLRKKAKLNKINSDEMSMNTDQVSTKRRPLLLDFVDNIENFTSDSEKSDCLPDREVLVEKSNQSNFDNENNTLNNSRKSINSALVAKDDVIINDFIVDDMPTKRKRQSKISYTKDTAENQNIETSFEVKINKKKKSRPKNLKQKQIDVYADIDLTDDTSNDSIPPSISLMKNDTSVIIQSDDLSTSLPNNVNTNIFRIRIKVNEQMFLISIPNGNKATIEWLLEESKSRYKNFCGISTKLLLKTRDGALLNPTDIITDVILNNEELVGEVVGLDFPPALERYRKACTGNNIKPLTKIEEQLSFDQNFTDFRLTDFFLPKSMLDSIFSSITCSMCLATLEISQIFIGDQNFSLISNVLQTLPSINTLKFVCIGISSKGLQELSGLVSDGIKDEFKMIMKEPPLSQLMSLHLDNNDFDNINQFKISMGKIIKHCKSLTELSLKSCHLGGAIFDFQSTFHLALKESKVATLNLNDNQLGSTEYISNVFNSINHENIRSLNLSGTSVRKDGFILNGVWERLSCLENGLKELHLDSLPVCCNDITNNMHLEKLSLCYQACDFDSLLLLYKSCLKISNLMYLDLSFSKNLNNDMLLCIIQDLKSNLTLKSMILRCCAVSSPLLEDIFWSLSELSRSGLSYLDLSYNDINSQDKIKLFDSWKNIYLKNALNEFTESRCLLFVR